MSTVRTAAQREEDAQLRNLRDQADRSTAEAAQILAELTRRVNAARRPGEAARRLGTDARVAAVRALREGPGRILFFLPAGPEGRPTGRDRKEAGSRSASQRSAKRLALAAVPVLVVAAAVAYAATHGRPQQQPPAGPFKRIFPDTRETSRRR